MDGATDAIINITGGMDFSLIEAQEAAKVVTEASTSSDINLIYGVTINPELENEVVVTVIATGFEDNGYEVLTDATNRSVEKVVVKENTPEVIAPVSVAEVITSEEIDTSDEIEIPTFLKDRGF